MFHPTERGGVLHTQQDIEPILRQNQQLRNVSDGARWGDGDRVAQIPTAVYEELQKQGIIGQNHKILDQRRFHAWLNDPDNQVFRTRRGRV